MTYLLTFYQWVLTSTTLIKGFVDSYQSGYALPTQDQRYSASHTTSGSQSTQPSMLPQCYLVLNFRPRKNERLSLLSNVKRFGA